MFDQKVGKILTEIVEADVGLCRCHVYQKL